MLPRQKADQRTNSWYTLCPRKKQATLIFDITSPSVEIFLQFLKHWHQISYHLTYGVWTHRRLKSCWLFFLEYHAREGVPDTHSEYPWVETSASSGVGGAGPLTTLQLSDSGDAVSMRVTRVRKLRGIFWPTFALKNLHVACWAICWIVGLCNT